MGAPPTPAKPQPQRSIAEPTMAVGFTDPQGPKLWRVVPYVFPLFLLLFALFGPISGTPATLIGVGALVAFNSLGVVSLRQKRSRNATVSLGPGYITIEGTGTRNQRIFARDIVGATTARSSTGVLLTLQHQRRDQPVTLELKDDVEASRIRHALGIGHSGFGTISWRTQSDSTTRTAFVGRMLAIILGLLTIALTTLVSADAGIFSGIFLGQFGLIGTILGIMGLAARPAEPSVYMAAEGLRIKTPRGWFALPYDAVQNLDVHRRGLVFAVPEPYFKVAVERVGPSMGGASEHDLKALSSQILAAAQRARGMGPRKEDITGRIDVLRRHGESARDWLVRLDMAGQMLSAGPGYRGNSLDVEDLWTILEDPEAEPDLRAAAARVLRHSPHPNTKVRIDAAVAAVRDAVTNQRLRIAIRDDLDGASQELAYLDASEPARHPQQVRPVPGR